MIKQFKVSTSSSFTSRDSHSMENYLREIHSNPSLTSEQESDLFKRYKESGDQVALKKIVHANLKFVVSVAKSYQTKNITLSDLISEGNIGLIKAATKYDETLGYKLFLTQFGGYVNQLCTT